MPRFADIDPHAYNGHPLPEQFLREVFTASQLAEALGISSDEFFVRVRNGQVPPGVWLDSLDPPALVWWRDLMAPWLANGAPVAQLVTAHQHTVLTHFADCMLDEIAKRN